MANTNSTNGLSDIYLPPPRPPLTSQPPRHLNSNQDLLGRLNLHPAYDRYVRPFVRPVGEPAPPSLDRAKGKDKAGGLGGDPNAAPVIGPDGNPVPQAPVPHRIQHGLKGYFGDVPGGKLSLKNSDPLTDLVLGPPKQRVQIVPLDARSLENFNFTPIQRAPNPNANPNNSSSANGSSSSPPHVNGAGPSRPGGGSAGLGAASRKGGLPAGPKGTNGVTGNGNGTPLPPGFIPGLTKPRPDGPAAPKTASPFPQQPPGNGPPQRR